MADEHGEYDSGQQKWFCGYWMSEDEWLDVHDYAASRKGEQSDPDTDEE